MKTIDLNPSQYRVLRTVNGSSAGTVEGTVEGTARASRMSQSQSQARATAPNTKAKAKPALLTLPDTHPIYGIVNLALLTVTLYLLWANL